MKILSLQSENIKRLKAIRLDPNGKPVVIVGGKNAQGKTSVLDSIEMAFGGKSTIPKSPIRDGETKARIIVDTDEVLVTRTFTEAGSYIKVEPKDGATDKPPQEFLNDLVGSLSFDPLKFSNMKPDKRLELLRNIAGVDVSKYDTIIDKSFSERTFINREAKTLTGNYNSIPSVPKPDSEFISVSELSVQLEEINVKNQKIQNGVDKAASIANDCNETEGRINSLKEQLKAEEKKLEELSTSHVKAEKWISENSKIDTSEIKSKIENAESINTDIRRFNEKNEAFNKLSEKQRESKVLTDKIDKAKADKAKAISSAKLPIDGLSFDDSGVLFNSIPFDQASQAEKLRVSIAMGLALNPKLKVLLIRDGSLLDDDNLQLISDMVKDADAQIWIERVGEGEECSVIIEDGMIKSIK